MVDQKKEMREEGAYLPSSVIYAFYALIVIIVIWIQYTTMAPLGNVLLGLGPFILFVVIATSVRINRKVKDYLIIIAIFLLSGFYAGFSSNTLGVDTESLSVVNGVLILITIALISRVALRNDNAGSAVTEEKEEEIPLSERLKKIEDKCRSINFITGRLYSGKKMAEGRALLKISPGVYLTMRKLDPSKKEEREELEKSLRRIEGVIKKFGLEEEKVFGANAKEPNEKIIHRLVESEPKVAEWINDLNSELDAALREIRK